MQRIKYIIIYKIIIFLYILHHVHSFEIFLNQTDRNNDSYHIRLFEKRLLTIRIYSNEYQENSIGFKIQITTSNSHVINIQKEIPQYMNISNKNNLILEDLFILSNKNSWKEILNIYPSPRFINLNQSKYFDLIWSIETRQMKETNLSFILNVFYNNDTSISYRKSLHILVIQPKRRIDRAFQIILPFLVVFVSIQMGILLDTKILIELVKNPKSIFIGFLCQYGLMPCLAMTIAKIFHYSPLDSLVLFIIGCCPGSGASNQWTLLFDGDVNLSAVMSFVSTASSFIMMPLYLYTLGHIYTNELNLRIPFLSLVISLGLVVIPYSIGIFISYCSIKIRLIVEKLVKPIMLAILMFFLIFGTIVYWYITDIMDVYVGITASLLPYFGYILGACFAWIFGLNWCHVKTIGIESGLQNTNIALMIIYYSFPEIYATKGIVIPLIVSFMTTKPFWLVYVIRSRINRIRIKSHDLQDSEGNLTFVGEKPLEDNHDKTDDIIKIRQNL